MIFRLTLFIIFLPTLVLLISQQAIGRRPQHLKLAVLNEDNNFTYCSDYSNQELKNQSCFLEADPLYRISCFVLRNLRKRTYQTLEYTNFHAAQQAIHDRIVTGVLHFPSNYTESYINRINIGQHVTNSDLNTSTLHTWLDKANPILDTLLRYDIAMAVETMISSLLKKCDLNTEVGRYPIKLMESIHGKFQAEDVSYSVTNVMMVLGTFASPALYGLLLLYNERSAGVNERVTATGVSMKAMIFSGLFVLMLIYTIQITVMFFYVYGIFGLPIRGSFLLIVFLFYIQGLNGTMFGFLLSFMFDNLSVGTFAAGGVLIALALSSGIVWPIEAQHHLLAYIRWFFYDVKLVQGVKGINQKGYTITNPLIIDVLALNFAWFFAYAFFIYFYIRHRRKL